MSNRALREAAKAVERSKRASYGKDANTLSELLECVNTIMNEDEITQDVASNLVECFKTTAPAAYELLPRESLSLAGETIAYIAGIKLENAASSVTRKTKSPFEYWEEVLDCGLVSGLQAYQDSANYDKVLMGEVIIAPITRIWKSPLRSRLQIDFRVALLTLLSDCVRRCLPNANLLLDPEVFGSHQFGLAIATAYESLILEILLELLVRIIHAAFRSADSTRREVLWREILQSEPMRVAFGPDVVNDLTTVAVSANNVTFHTAMMKMMQLMAVDEARPQPFDASKIDINGQSYRPSSRQRSLVLEQDSIILNTSNERGNTESFIIRYATIKQIRIESDKRSVEVNLKLTTSAKPLFGRGVSQSANSALVALRVPSEDEKRLRNRLRARHQTTKIVPGDCTLHTKRMRSSKTEAIQLLPKFPLSSQAVASSAEERAQEIVLKANFESSDIGIENLTADTNPSPTSVIVPVVLDSSQQTLRVQDNHESEARALPPSIFDCASDDTLSEAPSPPPPGNRPVASPTRVDNSRACDVLNHTKHTPTPEAHANKLLHPTPVQEARGTPFKKPKLERTAAKTQATKEQDSPIMLSNTRTHRAMNTYKGRKAPRPSAASDADGHSPSPDLIDFDDIPSAERDSKQLSHQQTAKPKKRGRPPRRNPNLVFNGPAYGQQSDPKINSVSLKQPMRRILSDLEPALSQSIARSSHHTPTFVRQVLQADAARGQSDQNALKDATNFNVHAKHSAIIFNTDAEPASRHEPLSNFHVIDSPLSPNSLGDVTLVQGDILEAQAGAQEAVVQASVVEPAKKAQVIHDVTELAHDLFRIPSHSGGELVPSRPRSPAKAARAKGGVADRIPAANYASSSPTPGSRAQKGVLSLKKEQISKPWSERAQTAEIDDTKALRLSQTRAATAGPRTHFSKPGPPIVKEIVPESTFQRGEDNAAPGVWDGQQTPIRHHPRFPISSPLLASAMKPASNTGGPPRPRFSVSFVDDIEARPVSERYTVSENAPEFSSLLRTRRKHMVSEPPAPCTEPVDDVDANWAGDVLQILNLIGEAVIESKRNEFRSIRHDVLESRDAIINDIQLEVRREAELCAQHYTRFLELNSQHDVIGNQITGAFRELSSQNTNISNQLQETIRNHNTASLSAKMKTHVFKNRVLGPTFAACGVSLAE